MTHCPTLFLTSVAHRRSDVHETQLEEVAESWRRALKVYPGHTGARVLLHCDREDPGHQHTDLWAPFGRWAAHEIMHLFGPKDSRTLGGPRTTGWTQMLLAFMRSWLFQRWADESNPWELMLQIDSDVALHEQAINGAVAHWQALAEAYGPRVTLSLQIDNRVAEDDPPVPNAMTWKDAHGSDQNPLDPTRTSSMRLAPWGDAGDLLEVQRSGAVTIYPRAALHFRPTWEPLYREEHQKMFDEMAEHGWRHFLWRAPTMTDHRMPRMKSLRQVRDELRAERLWD